jgi:hypothetical protein
VRGEFARIEAGVRDVAPAAAGEAHLVEKARSFFEDGHIRALLRRRDGREKSRRPATDHDDLPRIQARRIAEFAPWLKKICPSRPQRRPP